MGASKRHLILGAMIEPMVEMEPPPPPNVLPKTFKLGSDGSADVDVELDALLAVFTAASKSGTDGSALAPAAPVTLERSEFTLVVPPVDVAVSIGGVAIGIVGSAGSVVEESVPSLRDEMIFEPSELVFPISKTAALAGEAMRSTANKAANTTEGTNFDNCIDSDLAPIIDVYSRV